MTEPRPDEQPAAAALVAVWKAGRAFARAQAARDKARDDLREKIRAAHAAGNAPQDLIEASGLARQTVFDAIKKPTGPPPEVVSYPETGAPS